MKKNKFERICKRLGLELDDDGTAHYQENNEYVFCIICSYTFGGGEIVLRSSYGDIPLYDQDFEDMSIKDLLRLSKMVRYKEESSDQDQQYVRINKIEVPTEFDKEQLLLASEYIHDMRELDTDFLAANTIAHLYTMPSIIEVKESKKNCRKAYVIRNMNPKRDCYYEVDGLHITPEWLRGDYARPTPPGGALVTTNDLTDAIFLFEEHIEQAKDMAKIATECYGYEGAWFTRFGARYPDSCTTVSDYEKVAPRFEIQEVLFSVELVE